MFVLAWCNYDFLCVVPGGGTRVEGKGKDEKRRKGGKECEKRKREEKARKSLPAVPTATLYASFP